MSIYDALDELGTGRVAVSVDIPGWAVVNLDTGQVERLYVERDEVNNIEPHEFVSGKYEPRANVYHNAMEVENQTRTDGTVYPAFTEDASTAVTERACEILRNGNVPDLEILR
jgi:hypothetical protein